MHFHPTLLVVLAANAANAAFPHKRSTSDATKLSGKTFDFVIVGGGTAGLALARRLAETLSDMTVAVIEAGSDGTEYQDQITIPGALFSFLNFAHLFIFLAGMSYLDGLTKTSYDWQYLTMREQQLLVGPEGRASGDRLR